MARPPNMIQTLTPEQIFAFVDAVGRKRAIGVCHCDCCSRGLVMGINTLPIGMHLSNTEAMYLVEALRAGPAFAMLKPSPNVTGRRYFTQRVNDGKYLLAYDDAGVCDFLCAGSVAYGMPGIGGAAAALTTEQRVQLSDRLFAELMKHAQGDVATA